MRVLGKKKALLHYLLTGVPFSAGILRFVSRQVYRNSLTILNYHQISQAQQYLPDWCCLSQSQFSEQMEYLVKHFEVVPLADGLEIIRHQKKTAKPLAAVTFDDGFYNNYQYAFPILKKLNIPATIFLATGIVDSQTTLWSCRLNKALYETSVTEFDWDGNRYQLASLQDKTLSFKKLQAQLKKLPNSSLLEQCRHIIMSLGGDMDEPVEQSSLYYMLDRAAIEDMLHSGLIDFGAHTQDHVILSRVSPREQQRQISISIAKLKELTGAQNVLFAYPNGTHVDYNHTAIEQLIKAGVQYAVTTTPGIIQQCTKPHELQRIGVGGDWPLGLFQFAIHTGRTASI